MTGTGKIIITGKNILKPTQNTPVPFELKANTTLTLITNGELSEGGNIKFTTVNGGTEWFGFDKGKTKMTHVLHQDVIAFSNWLVKKRTENMLICWGK